MSIESIKTLREKTNVSMAVCKEALLASGDDIEKAIEWMRVKGQLKAADVSNRTTTCGSVVSYIHPGALLGVLLQVECETDFVARGEDFQAFCRDVAMHIAAAKPHCMTSGEALGDPWVYSERRILLAEIDADPKTAKKDDGMKAKILDGKLQKIVKSIALLEQPFAKDPSKTVEQLRAELVLKTGENIQISAFKRFDVREGKPPIGHENCK